MFTEYPPSGNAAVSKSALESGRNRANAAGAELSDVPSCHSGILQLSPVAYCSLVARHPSIVHQPGTEVKHLPKIFIVDDNPAVMKVIEAILTPHGYDVRYFKSVEGFLAHHHPTQVGCVLIDLLLLGTSGSELLQCLQETGSLLSVVIISGLIAPPEFDDPELLSASLLEFQYEAATLVTMVVDGVAGSFRRRAERHRGEVLD
jgi:CheY-like chemotaxis protein